MNQLIDYLGQETYDNMMKCLENGICKRYPEYPDSPDNDSDYVVEGEDCEYFDMEENGQLCEVEVEYEYRVAFEPIGRERGYPGPDLIVGGELNECVITPIKINIIRDNDVNTTLDFVNQTITNN